jgi:Tfp pilus assembly protein PilV
MSMLHKIFKDDRGYTIIEALVSLVIFLIILIPTARLISYLLSDPRNMDKIIAVNLAEKEMEYSLLKHQPENSTHNEKINGKEYVIKREIEREDELLKILVEVYRLNQKRPLVKFETFRLTY